jgi:4-amino-4-deoxy-L-arabinose transferase-like glycosyltransferase
MIINPVVERETTQSDAPAPPTPRTSRWRFWVSPADQPGWTRPALLSVTAIVVVLYAWSLPANGFAPYYSSGVLSMTGSWKAFFFGAFDPNATIMMDKLPGGFIPQAVSVWLFGPHPWAMALPQVIYGAVAVLVMFRVVRLWAGPRAGLLAATIFAFTPLLVSMFGHPMVDGALTVCLVLAADACQRSVHTGRLRWLLLAGMWVGLGFQAKAMQAWVILPALGIGYLVATRGRWSRRLGHLLAALAVTIGVSFAWTAAMGVVPADSRPYADGTTNNSVWTMVVGYNGLERFGVHLPGSVLLKPSDSSGDQQSGGGGQNAGMPPDLATMFVLRYVTQVAWLVPLALLSMVYGLSRWRRQDRARNGGYLMWTTWLVVNIAVFSVVDIVHTAYLATLIPPIAALCAMGTVEMWRAYRERRRGTRWLLPAIVLVQGGYAAMIAAAADFLPWLAPAIGVLAVGSAVVLVARRRLASRALVAGLAAMLLAPIAWSASVLDHRYGGTSFDAEAGPMGPRVTSAFEELTVRYVGQAAVNAVAPVPASLTPHQRDILGYVNARRGGAEAPFVTDSWVVASRYIVGAGESPISMAGFQGSSPFPPFDEVRRLVGTGKIRFFLFTGVAGGIGDTPPSADTVATWRWVESTCRTVPASAYARGAPPPEDPTAKAVLHDCG